MEREEGKGLGRELGSELDLDLLFIYFSQDSRAEFGQLGKTKVFVGGL